MFTSINIIYFRYFLKTRQYNLILVAQLEIQQHKNKAADVMNLQNAVISMCECLKNVILKYSVSS